MTAHMKRRHSSAAATAVATQYPYSGELVWAQKGKNSVGTSWYVHTNRKMKSATIAPKYSQRRFKIRICRSMPCLRLPRPQSMYMSHQKVYRVDATNMRAQMTESALREHACQEATFVERYEKQCKFQLVFRKNNDTVLRTGVS